MFDFFFFLAAKQFNAENEAGYIFCDMSDRYHAHFQQRSEYRYYCMIQIQIVVFSSICNAHPDYSLPHDLTLVNDPSWKISAIKMNHQNLN